MLAVVGTVNPDRRHRWLRSLFFGAGWLDSERLLYIWQLDNTGNNYIHDGTGSNTYRFVENNSGPDTIVNLNIRTDQLRIGANLGGNGMTSAFTTDCRCC